MFNNVNFSELNKKQVIKSIWVMLPVSCILVLLISFSYNPRWENFVLVPLTILSYGAIIWVPSMLFTAITEHLMLHKYSNLTKVRGIFAFETMVTFGIVAIVFGSFSFKIPVLALGMSIIIQIVRYFYLVNNGRIYIQPTAPNSNQLTNKK